MKTNAYGIIMTIYELLKQRSNSININNYSKISVNRATPYLLASLILSLLTFVCFLKNYEVMFLFFFTILTFLTFTLYQDYREEKIILDKYNSFLEKIENNNLSYLYDFVITAHNKNIKSELIDKLNHYLSECENISDKQSRANYVEQIGISNLDKEIVFEYNRILSCA